MIVTAAASKCVKCVNGCEQTYTTDNDDMFAVCEFVHLLISIEHCHPRVAATVYISPT